MTEPVPAVELRGLSKSFTRARGRVDANVDIRLRVSPGTVHAIIGENGAGKSTAMKMLYGMLRPDAGEILVDGTPREWSSPSHAIEAGIGMVHQHFMLAGPEDATDNIVLGAEPVRAAWRWVPSFLRPVDRAGAGQRLRELAAQYGLAVDWTRSIEELPVGVQQRIEILKVLYREARILILDEPTAVLTPKETQELFSQLRKLVGEGKTILIITHKLKEVMAVADHVTVFRAGRVVGDLPTAGTSVEELASLMVGRKVKLHAEAPPKVPLGKRALEVKGLSVPGALQELSFGVSGGEVVGIAGVEGNGQSELLHAILRPRDFGSATGRVEVLGREVLSTGARPMSTRQIKELGVGVVPEDRQREGLLLDRPVSENFLLGLQRRPPFSKSGILSYAGLRAAASRAVENFDVRPRELELAAGGLSGGNQQKLIIAREFQQKPGLLIAAKPTRGVDVGAIEFIHQRILEARSAGAAVLLVSSELDEILALSDRILVMYEGRIVAEFARGEATEQTLGLAMGGARAGATP